MNENQQPEIIQEPPATPTRDPEKIALNKRLEGIAWGCFLIIAGGFAFLREQAPSGSWSIAVGLVMLGLNAARYMNHIRMSGFTTFLGILGVLGGLFELLSGRDFGGALLLIILGSYFLLKPWLEKQKLFGKAEES